MKIIVAICGASGIGYGIELLKALKEAEIETHLILSEWAEKLIEEETKESIAQVKKLAGKVYGYKDMGAAISSSSFLVDGMIVCPATVKTVSEIANADSSNLISRAADNMLKMRKKLVVCIRETPLSGPCLENLTKISQYGGIVMPLSPGFYHKPKTIKDLEAFIIGKIMDLLGIENSKFERWGK
ncbi:MAG: UbiX family flavin prenyltransferase [Candidatus Diapherotrites archaeon]|nr:UbiX family flavin prenyltransferase [Candidatus Diapherotrites archaeon]